MGIDKIFKLSIFAFYGLYNLVLHDTGFFIVLDLRPTKYHLKVAGGGGGGWGGGAQTANYFK